MSRFVLLQPTTFERNLSGICYKIYWAYSALRKAGLPVEIIEDATLARADAVIRASSSATIICDLSTYPQIDLILDLVRSYPNRLQFIGYSPLIKRLRLPEFDFSPLGVDVLEGAWAYPYYYDHFDRGLLSDCDEHIVSAGRDKSRVVVPVFLSVGCRRKCPYCYVGTEGYPYGQLADIETINHVLSYVDERGWDVHFCDEDFFAHPLLGEILDILSRKSIRWIALGSSVSLSAAIKKYGPERLRAAGYYLSEVGLETVSSDVLRKNQNLGPILESGLRTLWLTVTFFPSETLASLNATGRFMKSYGMKYEEMVERLRTNGTEGGLGQFYQPYAGTPWAEGPRTGRMLTARPTRLWPSFVGFEFLAEKPAQIVDLPGDFEKWGRLYGLSKSDAEDVLARLRGERIWREFKKPAEYVLLAQLARLRVIR